MLISTFSCLKTKEEITPIVPPKTLAEQVQSSDGLLHYEIKVPFDIGEEKSYSGTILNIKPIDNLIQIFSSTLHIISFGGFRKQKLNPSKIVLDETNYDNIKSIVIKSLSFDIKLERTGSFLSLISDILTFNWFLSLNFLNELEFYIASEEEFKKGKSVLLAGYYSKYPYLLKFLEDDNCEKICKLNFLISDGSYKLNEVKNNPLLSEGMPSNEQVREDMERRMNPANLSGNTAATRISADNAVTIETGTGNKFDLIPYLKNNTPFYIIPYIKSISYSQI